jgi:sugar phosphate isomerase/epimerase
MIDKQISISSCFDYEIPIERQIPLIARAGFSHISLGQNQSHFNYQSLENRRKILKLIKEYSLQIDTIHGPQADKTSAAELTTLAESAAELQSPVVVLHGGPFEFGAEELERRIKDLERLCEEIDIISQHTGVKFALENVLPGPSTELMRRTLLETNSPNIGFCYDSSHDQIGGPNPFELLKELKDKLIAVHLSDRIKEFVDHVIPGEGFIDWNGLCTILKDSRILFPLLLEVMITNSSEKDSTMFLNLAFKRGSALYDQIYL